MGPTGEDARDMPTPELGRKKRGRPQKISEVRKEAATKKKASGGTNREAAALLYDAKYPTAQQVKNVPAILRNYNSKRSGSLVLPRKTSPKPSNSRG